MTGVEKLLLSRNELTGLADGLFADLSGLRTLNLSSNSFSRLETAWFSGLGALEELRLGKNALTTDGLPAGLLSSLPQLTYLQLSNNALTHLPEGLFLGASRLETLRLKGNSGANFQLRLELVADGQQAVKLRLREAAPFPISAELSATGGALGQSDLQIAAGATESSVVQLTPDNSGTLTVTVDSAAFDSGDHNGIELVLPRPLLLGAAWRRARTRCS